MELLQLKYFQEIATTQNISKTANQLHVAQPSLSQTLKRLETEVGTPLFDRIGKHIELNACGTIFLKYVNDIFLSLDNANAEIGARLERESNTVTLCMQSASMLLPDLYREIKESNPSLLLQIFQTQTTDKYDSSDLTVFSSQQIPDNQDCQVLMEESIVIAMPKDHPLAAKKKIFMEDLRNEFFLSLSPSCHLYQTIGHYLSRMDCVPPISTFVDTPQLMRELLKCGQGIAFTPSLTWKDFASSSIVTREISDCPMRRYILLKWNEKKFATAAMISCRNSIEDYFTRYNLQCQSSVAL